MAVTVHLDALNKDYRVPSRGEVDWSSLSSLLVDLTNTVNDTTGGSLVSPVFNVTSYGALGNGVADDTAAIEAAKTALAATGLVGGTLYFPAGTYKFTSRLQFGVAASQRNVKIVGDGVSSVLKPTGAFSTNPCIEFRNCDYWAITDVKIDASARTGTGDTVLIDGCSFGRLMDCHVSGSTRYGVRIDQISGSGASTANTVTSNVYASNTTANVFVAAAQTGNIVNESNGIFAGPQTVDVKTRFGLAADGTTDDTARVQSALDFAFTEIQAGRGCVLQFPRGDIVISSTLVVKGNSSSSPVLVGASPYGSPAFNTPATRFKWIGSANGTMFYFESFNKGSVIGIHALGNDIAGCGFHFAATTYADQAILAASSGWTVEGCRVCNFKVGVAGNACVKIGTDPTLTGGLTFQSSEGVFRRCDFVGESTGATGFAFASLAVDGIKTMSGGNCKNFAVHDCTFNVCADAIDWDQASGNFIVTNFNGANVRKGIRQSDGHMTVIGGDLECGDVTDFQLLVGTGGGGDASTELRSVEALGFMANVSGKGNVIDFAGNLCLTGCLFSNSNQSASPGTNNPVQVKISAAIDQTGSLTSIGNWYCGAVDWIPLIDGSGNTLSPATSAYGATVPLRIRSFGDKGSSGASIGTTPVALGAFDSSAPKFFSASFNGPLNFSYLSSNSAADATAPLKTVAPVTAAAGNQTFTLATAAASNIGRVTIVSKIDGTANTVTCNGVVLRSQYECAVFVSNGTTWDLLGIFLTAGAQLINGTKTFASPIVHSATTGITAFAGGGQSSATALTAAVNFVTTVATTADSVKLPVAIFGMEITVFNQGANSVDIFPVSGSAIDALGANNPYALAAGSSKKFYARSSTAWFSL